VNKTKAEKKPLAELPPQQSAADTSNWENRNVSAISVNLAIKKRVVRDIEFIEPKKNDGLTLTQIQRLQAKDRAKKTSK
jgi:hypothetical protein